MIEKIYDNNVLLYIVVAVSSLCILARIGLVLLYRSLIKEASSPGIGRCKRYSRSFIGRITDKFAYEYEKSYSVNNVSIFVDKYMYEVKMLGIKSYTWESIEVVSVIVCLAAGTLGAFWSYYYKDEQIIMIRYVLEGLIASGMIIISDALFDLASRRMQLHTNICDYLENYMKPRLERGEYVSNLSESVNLMDEVDEGMLELIDSLDKRQGSTEDTESENNNLLMKTTDEDDRILEDVIREYLT